MTEPPGILPAARVGSSGGRGGVSGFQTTKVVVQTPRICKRQFAEEDELRRMAHICLSASELDEFMAKEGCRDEP